VEAAKEMTGRLLEEYHKTRRLLARETSGSLAGLTSQVRPGDYLAVLAYLSPTIEVDDALDGLLRRVAERYKIATTVGYGPRYLHSTGQLHKGGPDIGLFLLLTADHDLDLAIPGEAHTFGVLADAQASGDLQALQLRGRRVFRLHLKGDPVDGIRGLAQEI
ncbi:MAG: glucose-6-phosphate isomerase, partial [Dehalococcoidia bacterium]|nr:glucose-6-phosphate isomerase [Dehalococcoidia bacterium]